MQGGRRSYADDHDSQDRYRVLSFDGQEVPVEEAFADAAAAEAASQLEAAHEGGNGSGGSNGKQQEAAQQELKQAEHAAELVG